jgi:hypothetical protein
VVVPGGVITTSGSIDVASLRLLLRIFDFLPILFFRLCATLMSRLRSSHYIDADVMCNRYQLGINIFSLSKKESNGRSCAFHTQFYTTVLRNFSDDLYCGR